MRSRIAEIGSPRIHVAHLVALRKKFVEPRIDVVAQHYRHFQARRQPHHFARAGHRVHPAGIGDHAHAALADMPRDPRDQRRKVARITQIRVGLLLLLQDRHGDLGQVVERQVVDRPLLHQAHRSFQPVAPESLPVRNPNHRSAAL